MAAQSLLHGLPATPVNSLSSSSYVTKEFPHVVFSARILCMDGADNVQICCGSSFHVVSRVAIVSFRFPGSILAFLSREFDHLKLPDVEFLSFCGRRGWMSHLRFVRVLPNKECESRVCFFLYSPYVD